MFGKIFGQIFDSSIACSPDLRHFFMDLIVLADAEGDVDMTPESIAARTRISLEKVNAYLDCLSKPDPRSRTPDKEGRRIELMDGHRDWGWRIINYTKFREIATNEQRKASQRERVRRFREKTSESCNAHVTHGNACNAMQRQKQMQKQKQKQKNTSVEIDEFPEALNCDVFKEVWDRWHQHLKEKRKPATVNARVLQLGKLESMGLERAIAAINHSIEHNWQGIYEPATQVYGANSKAGNAKSITPVRGSSPVGGF